MKFSLVLLLFTLYEQINSQFVQDDLFEYYKKRNLQENEINLIQWKPFQIYFEYICQEDNKIQEYIKSILDISAVFFGKHLLVRDSGEILNFGQKNTCGGIEIPEKYRNQNYSYHLVIFVSFTHEKNKTYLAFSGPCKITAFDYRPTFGIINWNIEQLNIENVNHFIFQRNLQTAIHEIIHTLGFIKVLYDYYYDPQTLNFYNLTYLMDDFNHLILQTPRLINVTKQYFECNSAKGAYMENEGGNNTADHHFERTIYFNEIMTGSQMNGLWVFSIFTFQLLQDTGFYRLLQYKIDHINWGKNKGCDFLEKSCQELSKSNNYNEFCSKNGYSCSFDGYGVGKCGYDQLSDSCSYLNVLKGMFCLDKFQYQNSWQVQHFQATQGILGQQNYPSKCFQINQNLSDDNESKNQYEIIQASCYQYFCQDNNIYINIKESNLKKLIHCPDNSSITINELNLKINCQNNSTQICQERNDCIDQCNSRGFCINKQCTCIKGYSGYSCENICQYYRKENKCLEQCDLQDYQDQNSMYCLTCPGNCLNCKKIDECLQCESGYVLNEGFCDPFYEQVNKNLNELIISILFRVFIIIFI